MAARDASSRIVTLADRIASANSLSELALCLAGDPRLSRPFKDVVDALALPLKDQLRLKDSGGLQAMTLQQWLLRRELHRTCGVRYQDLLSAFRKWSALPAPTLAAAPFECFSDLVDELPEGTEQLMVGEILPELDLTPKAATALKRFAAYSLVEFCEQADDASLSDDAFFEILDRLAEWTTREDDGTAPAKPDAGVEALRARCAAFGIPDLERWSLRSLNAVAPALEVGHAFSVLPPQLLSASFDAFERTLSQLRERPAPPVPSLPTPALARLQQSALAARLALAAYPVGIFSAQVRVSSRAEAFQFDVTPTGTHDLGIVRTEVPLAKWVERPLLSCTCSPEDTKVCRHRVVVLEGLAYTWCLDPTLTQTFTKVLTPPWERLLAELGSVEPEPPRPPVVASFAVFPQRLEVRQHAVGKRGPSAKGKAVTPNSLLGRLEGAENRVVEHLALADPVSRWAASRHTGDAMVALVGHPRVFFAHEKEPVPVLAAQARVVVDEREEGYQLQLFVGEVECTEKDLIVFPSSSGGVAIARGPGGALLVAPFDRSLQRLREAMSKYGGALPKEAAPKVVEVLPKLDRAAVVELPEQLRGDELPAVVAPVVQVTGSIEALTLAVRVEPLPKGPLFVPGQGVAVSAAFDGHRRTFARRQLEAEVTAAQALASELGLDPALAEPPWTWRLEASDRHVETLRRLSAAPVPVEWKAPRVSFTSAAKLGRLKLAVTKQKDWFGLDGEVTVDERRVSLAALLEAARARRRFVRLAPGQFAQLSDELIDALSPLAHLAPEGKLPEVTLGTAPLLDALAPQVEALEAAKEWQALLARLSASKEAKFPLPRGLQVELRDYQVEGFQWLSRLAAWGAGACLADDMGLGKTAQTLALLLSRAKQGPQLVVAPSSVLHTWRAEAARFTPKLKLALFHEGDRALGALGPNDVVVVSWTLLAREAEAFSKVRFTTAVLDEAHAIKNAGTMRAKAAHGLDAEFVVALSGTPVENHVGELWSLLKAVMPALLGSEESFRRRFGAGSPAALQALATVVRPFILRRTKDAVAKELPPRTDLEVVVPLSAEERALYDDVRLAAEKDLGDVTGESKRFDVLAALTRLRLTACHPKLVAADWTGPTSKLTRLLELVKDLVSARHRVLVFSQFTQHLALVVAALRAEGLVYSYLDGQVPVAERQRRVEAFQRGEGGDVFLVSLKAGGTGLTLTAADYVIHLDPWWNPAVEDQASDRAHRLGQTKPVTVYRLIAEATIEQQILSLHQEKRELVDALLAGSDTAGKLSTADLAKLIRSV